VVREKYWKRQWIITALVIIAVLIGVFFIGRHFYGEFFSRKVEPIDVPQNWVLYHVESRGENLIYYIRNLRASAENDLGQLMTAIWENASQYWAEQDTDKGNIVICFMRAVPALDASGAETQILTVAFYWMCDQAAVEYALENEKVAEMDDYDLIGFMTTVLATWVVRWEELPTDVITSFGYDYAVQNILNAR
jgi:hypothetical protein